MKRSKYDRTPVSKKTKITPRGLTVLSVLNRYPILTTSHIYGFAGGHINALQHKLREISDAGYIGCNTDALQTAHNDRALQLAYHLTDTGKKKLKEFGIPVREHPWLTGPFWHDLAACQAVASMELAAGRFIDSTEILSQSRTNLPQPFTYNVEIKGEKIAFRPDWPPFGFQIGDKRNVVAALEIDMRTEPLTSQDLKRSSIYKKLLAYKDLGIGLENSVIMHRFKIPTDYVLFLTVNETHKRSIMQLVKEVCPAQSNWFLFKTIPNLQRCRYSPPPMLELLTEPWERPGALPVRLDRIQEE